VIIQPAPKNQGTTPLQRCEQRSISMMGNNRSHPAAPPAQTPQRRNRRPKRRELFCPAHPEQRIEGNGQKYFLHLLKPEELKARGMGLKRAQLVLETYPVLVLDNEWLEELFCPQCGSSRWFHITRLDRLAHQVRWAPRELWQQVAHVDPVHPNPTVSEFTRRSARRPSLKRADGKRFFDYR
jgi:hypothetical protein